MDREDAKSSTVTLQWKPPPLPIVISDFPLSTGDTNPRLEAVNPNSATGVMLQQESVSASIDIEEIPFFILGDTTSEGTCPEDVDSDIASTSIESRRIPSPAGIDIGKFLLAVGGTTATESVMPMVDPKTMQGTFGPQRRSSTRLSSRSQSSRTTCTSSSTILGPGADTGRFLKALGGAILDRAADVIIQIKLRFARTKLTAWRERGFRGGTRDVKEVLIVLRELSRPEYSRQVSSIMQSASHDLHFGVLAGMPFIGSDAHVSCLTLAILSWITSDDFTLPPGYAFYDVVRLRFGLELDTGFTLAQQVATEIVLVNFLWNMNQIQSLGLSQSKSCQTLNLHTVCMTMVLFCGSFQEIKSRLL